MTTFDSGRSSARKADSSDIPPNLLQFMLQGWRKRVRKDSGRLPNVDHFRRRRERLSQRFPGEVLVIPTGHFKVRANDTFYPFRPASDFFYLTGNLEPDCVLVLLPQGRHRAMLFVEPDPGHSDAAFFTDRVKGALWEGPRLG